MDTPVTQANAWMSGRLLDPLLDHMSNLLPPDPHLDTVYLWMIHNVAWMVILPLLVGAKLGATGWP